MEREHFIRNYEGTIKWQDTDVLYFKIVNRVLVDYKMYESKAPCPAEVGIWGMSYRSLNDFFNRRCFQEGAQFSHYLLQSLGLTHYDFEEIIKRQHASGHDHFWVRTNEGPQTYEEMCQWQQETLPQATLILVDD